MIDMLLKIIHIVPESVELLRSVETAFSKIVLLFLYYAIFSRMWKKRAVRTKTQYILCFIMFLYSVVNILAIAMISSKENPIVLMMFVGCTIFANMYLLYFIKFSDEGNYYKLQFEMMKQQEKLQYYSYEMQREKYTEAMAILHDVDKHIKMIEGLSRGGQDNDAIHYTKQINGMLKPLVPFQYTDNPILNCLLYDKIKTAKKLDITFKIETHMADINFMKPIDITTLFGNLIDNAIAASGKCKEQKYIGFFMKPYKEMVSIRIENSVSKSVPIKKGQIESEKDGQRGIGILNIQRCIDGYDGSMIYRNTDGLLECDVMLNRADV